VGFGGTRNLNERVESLPAARVTWSRLATGWLVLDRNFALACWLLPVPIALTVIRFPAPSTIFGVVAMLAAFLWSSPTAIVLLMIALMGNAKIHYYTGSLTIFPEYPLIALALLIGVLQWMEGRARQIERRVMLVFAWFAFAGVISFVNAINIPRVFSKESVLVITMFEFALVLRGVQSIVEMRRVLVWLEWAAAVVAGYGVLQIAGALVGWDTSLHYFEAHGNPDFYYGIGPPVIYQFTKIFRANSFFSDSNILGGYVAALVPIVLALRVHHSANGHRMRATGETALLVILGLAMLFTLSRSGILALACGVTAVLVGMRHSVRWRSFWIGATVLIGVTAAVSTLLGINPVVLFARLGASLDLGDYSNRTHYSVGAYAVQLFLRYPLTGAGLRNFGYNYANEVDPNFPNMIAHNAFLGYFAETGLLGGAAFVTLIVMIFRRSWRAVRDPSLAQDSPQLYAWNVGLFGALVALAVSNIFYDFYLRTFTWVLSGLAVAAAQLARQRTMPSQADG
jgi:O-antigen ligase